MAQKERRAIEARKLRQLEEKNVKPVFEPCFKGISPGSGGHLAEKKGD